MNADFQRVKEIFLASLKKEVGPAREAILDEACGSDESLRQQVEALIERHEQAADFLEIPPDAARAESTTSVRGGSPRRRDRALQAAAANRRGRGGFSI